MFKAHHLAILVALLSAGCRKDSPATSTGSSFASEVTTRLTVTSSSFDANGSIPPQFTCEGGDASPAISWSDPPPETKSIAIVVDDPDAPDPAAPKQVFVHWVLYNIAPTTRTIPEGAKTAAAIGGGARDGKSDFGEIGWRGPCPPKGRHRYFFKVYALDAVLPDLGEPTKAALEKAMSGHVVAKGELVGTYEKGAK